MKKFTIVAGANGAGKSTLYQLDPDLKCENRVNADEILKESGGDWKNLADIFKAGKRAVTLLNSYIEEGVSFNQETTLCGNSVIRNITRAKENGYLIEIETTFEMNPGNHFKDADLRLAKGIAWILK
ncbi:hypothetical protein [Butyrivibrio sp. INlla16]|uniref:hypothetical protein n=1 Tax=Butyrivibrio sp. INlla16 TaxID=1520807 RepID=UPI00088AAF66|nr:hypothetical protein [Butyrivibrio sp. INlla16]SDB11638.1 hypothetical protein SAMN02910263_00568 [Butyrivibrio sp. INlla16]